MSTIWAFWKDALDGKSPPMHEGEYRAGFYRLRSKDKRTGAITYQPVAVYPDGFGSLACRIGDKDVTPERAGEQWTYFGQNPITEEEYRRVAESGQNWSDLDATVADHLNGTNEPSDPATILMDQIASASAGAGEYFTIDSDAKQARAQSLRARLLELRGQADSKREELKRPHLDANTAIDAKWMPLVKTAKNAADAIRTAMEAWDDAKDKAAREAQELARKAIAEAADKGVIVPPPEPLPIIPAASSVKGAYGRAANSKPVPIAVMQDVDLCFGHFRNRLEVHGLLLQLAQREVDAGKQVPGITVEQKRRIRS